MNIYYFQQFYRCQSTIRDPSKYRKNWRFLCRSSINKLQFFFLATRSFLSFIEDVYVKPFQFSSKTISIFIRGNFRNCNFSKMWSVPFKYNLSFYIPNKISNRFIIRYMKRFPNYWILAINNSLTHNLMLILFYWTDCKTLKGKSDPFMYSACSFFFKKFKS